MQKWEYKVIFFTALSSMSSSTHSLNELGEEGWEVVAVVGGGGRYEFLLKRPKD